MKKLRLRLDDLRIDSFQTANTETPEGTVFGEQCTCAGSPTCDASCGDSCLSCEPTCQQSCYGTCDYFNPSCVYTSCYSRDVSPEFCM